MGFIPDWDIFWQGNKKGRLSWFSRLTNWIIIIFGSIGLVYVFATDSNFRIGTISIIIGSVALTILACLFKKYADFFAALIKAALFFWLIWMLLEALRRLY